LNCTLRKLLLRFYNALWEYRLGINSRGISKTLMESDSYDYSTISYLAIMAILRSLSLKPSDVFVDLGCGKGRVLCCASRFNIQEIIGVEINKALCDIAERNARKLHGKKSCIKILNVSAKDFDYRRGTVYYLFNPFGVSTLSSVLTKLEQSARLYPRKIRIVYVNPVDEFLLAERSWLEMYDRWDVGEKFALMNNVSFWRVKD
jgi:SAM-dependent methyltransferase